MSDNIIPLNVITTVDIPAEKILDSAKEMQFDHVIVIGSKDNELRYLSSTADCPTLLWYMENFKQELLSDG